MDKINYTRYQVIMQCIGRIEGGVPKNPAVIESWLATKGKSQADIVQATQEAMGMESLDAAVAAVEAVQKNWCGFKCGPQGLYIEARQIKAALKEAANITREQLGIKNARSKLAERLWIIGAGEDHEQILLGKSEPDGYEERAVHAWVKMQQVHSIKRTDYVSRPKLEFIIEVLDDAIFKPELLRELFIYVGKNGIGANRSQGAGVCELVSMEKL